MNGTLLKGIWRYILGRSWRKWGRRTLQEHEELRYFAQEIRDKHEDENRGGLIKIYPAADHYCYMKYLKYSNSLWNGGKSTLHIPKLRNENLCFLEKEIKPTQKPQKTDRPFTPLKLAGDRTSPTRMKLISKALCFASGEIGHSRSKSNFIPSATDLEF